MDCRSVREVLEAGGWERIDDVTHEEVALHLKGCAGCRQELEESARLANHLRDYAVPPVPEAFLDQVLARVREREDALGGPAPAGGLLLRHARGRLAWLTFGLACVVLGVVGTLAFVGPADRHGLKTASLRPRGEGSPPPRVPDAPQRPRLPEPPPPPPPIRAVPPVPAVPERPGPRLPATPAPSASGVPGGDGGATVLRFRRTWPGNECPDRVVRLHWLAGSQRFLAAKADGTVRIWSSVSGRCERVLSRTPAPLTDAVVLEGGAMAFAAGDGVRFLSSIDQDRAPVVLSRSGGIRSLAAHPSGRVFAGRDGSGRLVVWQADGRSVVFTRVEDPGVGPVAGAGRRTPICFSPDGGTLAVASARGPIHLYAFDAARWRLLRMLDAGFPVHGLAFSPDGTRLAVAAERLTVWDVAGGTRTAEVPDSKDCASGVAFLPDGARLVACGRAGLSLADVRTGEKLETLRGRRAALCSLAVSGEGTVLVGDESGGLALLEGSALRWLEAGFDPGPGAFRPEADRDEEPVVGLAYRPDGRAVAVAAGDTVSFWDPAAPRRVSGISNGRPIVVLAARGDALAWLDRSSWPRLVCAEPRPLPPVWAGWNPQDYTTVAQPFFPVGPASPPPCPGDALRQSLPDLVSNPAGTRADPTADGRCLILTRGWKGEVFDAATGRLVLSWHRPPGGSLPVFGLSAGGEILWTGNDAGDIVPFRPGKSLRTASGAHRGAVRALGGDPSGLLLASAGEDSRVRLWTAGLETALGEASVPAHAGLPNALVFSPDSTTLLVGTSIGRIVEFRIDPAWRSAVLPPGTPGQAPVRSTPRPGSGPH